MTGDWAGASGGVQVVRSGHVEGSEVPVVVLNNISRILKIFLMLSFYYQTQLIEYVEVEIVQHHVS